MFWALLLVCAARTVFGVIVRDPEPLEEEYSYFYEDEDPTMVDGRNLQEARLGLVGAGRYCVLEPEDGTYTADPYAGFKDVLVQEHAFPHTKLQEYISYEDQLPQLGNPHYKLQTNRHSKPRTKYFTPANEISSKKSPFDGLYFEPNRKLNKKLRNPFM